MIPTYSCPLWLPPDAPTYVTRMDDGEKCWLSLDRDFGYYGPKKYRDDAAASRSRFAGTWIRSESRYRKVVMWTEYERVRPVIVWGIVQKLQSRMYSATKRYDRSELPVRPCSMATSFLGCTPSELIERFESLMQPGMDWTNCGRGGWQIDHIQPISIFDLRRLDHIQTVCHADNLRPCWEKENLSKHCRPLPLKG